MLAELVELGRAYRGRMMVRSKCQPQIMRHVHRDDPASPLLHYATRCPCGVQYCRITPEGKVTPCPYLPAVAGDLRRESSPPCGATRRSSARCASGELGGRMRPVRVPRRLRRLPRPRLGRRRRPPRRRRLLRLRAGRHGAARSCPAPSHLRRGGGGRAGLDGRRPPPRRAHPLLRPRRRGDAASRPTPAARASPRSPRSSSTPSAATCRSTSRSACRSSRAAGEVTEAEAELPGEASWNGLRSRASMGPLLTIDQSPGCAF